MAGAAARGDPDDFTGLLVLADAADEAYGEDAGYGARVRAVAAAWAVACRVLADPPIPQRPDRVNPWAVAWFDRRFVRWPTRLARPRAAQDPDESALEAYRRVLRLADADHPFSPLVRLTHAFFTWRRLAAAGGDLAAMARPFHRLAVLPPFTATGAEVARVVRVAQLLACALPDYRVPWSFVWPVRFWSHETTLLAARVVVGAVAHAGAFAADLDALRARRARARKGLLQSVSKLLDAELGVRLTRPVEDVV